MYEFVWVYIYIYINIILLYYTPFFAWVLQYLDTTGKKKSAAANISVY